MNWMDNDKVIWVILALVAFFFTLQMMRAVTTDTFQPKMAFKTRYGMVANPFAEGTTVGFGGIKTRANVYYRIFRVDNLHGVAS